MEKVIENAIEQSWQEFQEETPSFFMGSPSTCRKSHDKGWKEGAEWILTELLMNKKISKETIKKFMDEVNKINV
jgi:hypothetical protein